MSRENMITGQLILRESGEKAPGDNTDRKLMMVVGVLAVPKNLNLKGEHKYTIASQDLTSNLTSLYRLVDPDFGKMTKTFDEITLTLLPETGEDMSEEIKGDTLGNILHRGMWRV